MSNTFFFVCAALFSVLHKAMLIVFTVVFTFPSSCERRWRVHFSEVRTQSWGKGIGCLLMKPHQQTAPGGFLYLFIIKLTFYRGFDVELMKRLIPCYLQCLLHEHSPVFLCHSLCALLCIRRAGPMNCDRSDILNDILSFMRTWMEH